jgi:rare lipoprotein A
MVFLGLFLGACSFGGPVFQPTPPSPGTGGVKLGKPYKINGVWYQPKDELYYDRVGYASWYGSKFHGRKTASGERFNMNALTAAHTTLPMPSYVRVTNLSNRRSLVLQVNDRGPFAKGRIIDVSRRAAQLLGFARKGVQKVRVQRVNRDGRPLGPTRPKATMVAEAPKSVAPAGGGFYVQIGSFSDQLSARNLLPRLLGLGGVFIQPVFLSGQTLFRVRVGPFESRPAADEALELVWRRGFSTARVFTEP